MVAISKDDPQQELDGLNAELLEAARDVVAAWEKGDLAGAVNRMDCVIRQIDDLEEDE